MTDDNLPSDVDRDFKDRTVGERTRSYFWLGPLLIFVTLSAYKCFNVWGGSYEKLLLFLKLDLPILGLIILLSCLAGVLRPKSLRLPLHAVLFAMLLAFATHVVSLLLFDQNLTIQNIVDFAPEWKWDLTFIKWWHLLLMMAAIGVYFIRIPLSPALLPIFFLASPLCVIAGLWPTEQVFKLSPELKKYAYDVSDVHALFRGDRSAECRHAFSDKETESAKKELGTSEDIKISAPRPNILLVIVESLSAVDSFKTSGLRNIFPRLDKLSDEGMLFTNFFANYYQTNGSFVALLNQTAPVPFPESKVPMLSAFSVQRSVPRELKKLGYHTEFLLTGPLWFENLRNYLPRIGFDVVEGYEEIERFKGKPTFTCGVPADEWLFEEAAERAKNLAGQQSPFFISIVTTSSHVPWVDPLKRGDTEENVFDYVDRQLERLYEQLKENGFFEKGVLIITGDHRKPRPIEGEEWARYGETAKARVPLVVIGAGVPKGVVDDRFFQQAELLKRFDDIRNPSKPLSSEAVFVDHYSRLVWQDSPKGNLVLYRQGDNGVENYRAVVNGTCFEWKDAKPPQFDKIERRIQLARAAHQGAYLTAPQTCQAQIDPKTTFSQQAHGIEVRLFEGKDMNGFLDDKSGRFITKKVASKVSFDNFNEFASGKRNDFTVEFLGAITVPEQGIYWFNVESADGVCLSLDHKMVIDAADEKPVGEIAGHALLSKGRHVFLLRSNGGNNKVKLTWIQRPDKKYWTKPEKRQWKEIPEEAFFPPNR